MAHGLWQSSLTEEVPKVVRKYKELQPDMIVAEVMTGKPCPINRILFAPVKVGNKEPDSGGKLATMLFHFCDYPALMIPHCGLVEELMVPDNRHYRRTPDRPRHKMLDLTVQDVIGGQPNAYWKCSSSRYS